MDKHLITSDSTLHRALEMLNELSGQVMTLFVIDNAGKMVGTVTDGDLRRALLNGSLLSDRVDTAMHRKFKSLDINNIDVRAIKDCRRSNIMLIPCVDARGHITRILDLSQYDTLLPLSAILMAGGKGERLRPLTLTTPKPLLEIGGKAIMDYNIEALAKCGITDITVSIRYLADKMREHIAELSERLGIDIKWVEEDQALGTIGAAGLAQLPAEGYTFVMNSDLLTTVSFEEMYLHHVEQGADITIAAIPYQVSVPYAILSTSESDTSQVVGIEEKPSYSYFANAGIYIFPNTLLRTLPLDHRTDATDLIEEAIASGHRVTYFPINGTWIDIGSPTDFKQATELMKTLKAFNK